MAYGPLKARSELVMPAKLAGGGVLETTRRFHDASPAFIRPARSPTRGSGLGADAEMAADDAADELAGIMDPLAVEGPLDAHAPADASTSASDSLYSDGVVDMWTFTEEVVTGWKFRG